MATQKLDSTDAFVVVDFPDAPATGLVRRARKILQSSATDLARSASYTFGAFEIQRSGASAGINAEGEQAGPALDAFMAELEPRAAAGEVHLMAGKGVGDDELAPLRAANGLNPLAGSDKAVTAGLVAAASWAVGGSLEGRTVAIEQTEASSCPDDLVNALATIGAHLVEVDGTEEQPWKIWTTDADVIMAGSKPGVLNHQGAELIRAKAIVPWGPIPVTTKALARLLARGETVVVPDFVSAAGGLLAGYLDGSEAEIVRSMVDRITAVLSEVGDHPEGVLMGACYKAEAFMATWQEQLPFGRPLAA